jgi:hypothetical protein
MDTKGNLACAGAAAKKAKTDELQERADGSAQVSSAAGGTGFEAAKTAGGSSMPAFLQKSRVQAVYGQAPAAEGGGAPRDEPAAAAAEPGAT